MYFATFRRQNLLFGCIFSLFKQRGMLSFSYIVIFIFLYFSKAKFVVFFSLSIYISYFPTPNHAIFPLQCYFTLINKYLKSKPTIFIMFVLYQSNFQCLQLLLFLQISSFQHFSCTVPSFHCSVSYYQPTCMYFSVFCGFEAKSVITCTLLPVFSILAVK